MATLSEDQQLLNDFLRVPKNHRKNRAQAGQEVFSLFNEEHLAKLEDVSDDLEGTLNSTGSFSEMITHARQVAQTEDLELVQQATSKVVIENEKTRDRLQIPSLITRNPRTVLRHRQSKFGPDATAENERRVKEGTLPERQRLALQLNMGSAQERLAWWIEDPLMNEHHEHYHLVFRSSLNRDNKDRQGELFIYMHKQMLARYDAERRALGFEKVRALTNFREPLEGYTPLKELRQEPQTNFVYTARSANLSISSSNASRLERDRDAVRKAITDGRYRTMSGTYESLTPDALGGIIEPSRPRRNPGDVGGGSTYGSLHNSGHGAISALSNGNGVMGDPRTASRDVVFWRWHKFIDTLYNEWTNRHSPIDFKDAPKVQVNDVFFEDRTQLDRRNPSAKNDKYKAYGESAYGGAKFTEKNISTATNELQTMIDTRDFGWPEDSGRTETIRYVRPKEWVYFIRLTNTTSQTVPVTVRIFIVPLVDADDRTAWIEMDKFSYTVQPNAKFVVARNMDDSSVIRKRALKTAQQMNASVAFPSGDSRRGGIYCDCGWPYNLLLPRGTTQGIKYKLLTIVTDGRVDQNIEGLDNCSSVSFCGARDRDSYPDKRDMGYPFNAPFRNNSHTATFNNVPSAYLREFSIREVPLA